jgi:hypothetical protein
MRHVATRTIALLSGLGLLISMPVRAEGAGKETTALQFWHFANCAVDRDKWRAEKLLASPKDSEIGKEATRTLATKNVDCLKRSGQLRMSPGIMRDTVAGAYVARYFKHAVVGDFLAVPEMYSVERLADSIEPKARLENGLRRFSECVSRKDFPRVAAVLGKEPYSKEETALFAELGATMNACIPVEKGTKLGFGRLDLRARLGSVAYELATAAKLEPTNA